jgi:hypothetical protein
VERLFRTVHVIEHPLGDLAELVADKYERAEIRDIAIERGEALRVDGGQRLLREAGAVGIVGDPVAVDSISYSSVPEGGEASGSTLDFTSDNEGRTQCGSACTLKASPLPRS